MSYGVSQAFTAQGAQFSLGPKVGTSSPTFTPIYEITSAQFPEAMFNKVDVTNLNSPAKEYRKGIVDFGEVKMKGNISVSDAGQTAMAAAFADPTHVFLAQLAMPLAPTQTSTGDVYALEVVVFGWTRIGDLKPDGTVEFQATLQLNAAPVLTAGS